MRKEYDFSHALQGKFFRPMEEIQVPVYLDKDIARKIRRRTKKSSPTDVSALVNRVMRKELELLDSLS